MSDDPSANPPSDQDGQPGQYDPYPTSGAVRYPPYPTYGAAQYGAPIQYPPPPPNYQGWAIATLVLGFFGGVPGLILGIFAMVQSGKVMKRWSAGDAAGAARASRTTLTLCIVSLALWGIGFLAVILLLVFHGPLPS